jgi:predicted ATPase
MDSIVWDGVADRIRIRTKMTPMAPYTDETNDALTYELLLERIGKASTYRIENEILGNYAKVESGEMQQPFKLLERDARHAVVYSMNSQRFEVPPASVAEEESLLSAAAGPFSANRFVGEFQSEIANWKIHQGFQTHREAAIRAPQVTRADTQVSSDGQNLISVLHSLYTRSRDFESEIGMAMRAAFSEDFDKLVFPPAADQRIQMRIRWRSLKREQSTADLSDGTLRFLFLLAVFANPIPPPLIAIDEPETGLHPSMLPIVAEYARHAASKSQVILTTHSPEFLDAFGHDAPTTTIVERRDGRSEMRVLARDELSYWLKQYTLGELYRSHELEAMA